MKKPIALIILDGYGLGEENSTNAIHMAKTPNLDLLFENYPHSAISASGLNVGLPRGQMGNSEVGHTNIGAGRVVYQDLTRISKAIEDETFFENNTIKKAMHKARDSSKALHLMGLLSDGGVHSHIEHLYALLRMAKKENLSKVYIHCFTDGRDVSPTSGVEYLRELYDFTEKENIGQIATISGRYYAMDRDNRWDRVQLAYDAIVHGKGEINSNPVSVATLSYESDKTDEFIYPTICTQNATVKNGDSVIFFNFRPDRARELTEALVEKSFKGFEREKGALNVEYVCFTRYSDDFENVEVAFPPKELKNTLGEYLSALGKTQLRIAETEKYAHVTFFFGGGREEQYSCETRLLINSPKVATYDLMPEMSAYEVTERAVECIKSEKYDVIILNLANCDMVGHTGNMEATIKAVEAVDNCVKSLVDAVLAVQGTALITSDHGNAETMLSPEGAVITAHSTNDVPLILIGSEYSVKNGILADLAPTILSLMGEKIPDEMEGESLLI